MRVSGSGVRWCADMDGDECKEREREREKLGHGW